MKRLITIISALSITLISCQQNLVPDQPESTGLTDEVMTKSISIEKIDPDDPIIYLPDIDMKAWTDIGPLDDRFVACDIPTSRLSKMTTIALLKSIINYPLNYLIFAYNDPKCAIDIIVKNSHLHNEFLSRSDAAEVFLDLYSNSEMDVNIEKNNYECDYKHLSYTNAIFLDYFAASEVIQGFNNAPMKQELAEVVSQKLISRCKDPERFGLFSIEPLLAIDKSINLGVSAIETKASLISTVTVYTPWGQPVTADQMSDMSSYEAMQLEKIAKAEYPEAIVRGPATWSYNCHSYAWHNSSTDNNLCIRTDVANYWTNDLYIESTLDSEGNKVFYVNSDHSAIVLQNSNFISKWGAMPLMEHARNNCPYMPSDLKFYKKRNPEYLPLVISGHTPIGLNQSNSYSIGGLQGFSNVDLEWEVRYMDAPSPTPFNLIISPDERTAFLKCEDYGLFKTIVRGYRNGKFMAFGQLDIIVLP